MYLQMKTHTLDCDIILLCIEVIKHSNETHFTLKMFVVLILETFANTLSQHLNEAK